MINQYAAKEKEINRRHLETIEALEDIEAGRVLDGENVLDWLSSWGTENEQKLGGLSPNYLVKFGR